MRFLSSCHSPGSGTRFLVLVLTLVLQTWLVVAQTEVRVDEDDPRIVYTPLASWYRTPESTPMDSGGHHMVTTDASATATFQFTGTGIAFMSPLWADSVSTQLRLDGGVPVVVDLTDHTQPLEDQGPSTVRSAIVWQQTGLDNTLHTLEISVPPTGTYAVVDMLIFYEQTETTTDTETTATATSTTTRTNEAVETGVGVTSARDRTGLSIALGIVCSVFVLLVVAGFIFWWRRRKQKQREAELWQQTIPDPKPDMNEVNDGITAARGHRFKSVPSARNLRANSDAGSFDAEQSRIGKQGSKLRHVVATQDRPLSSSAAAAAIAQYRQTGPRTSFQSHTRSHSHSQDTALSSRMFTLSPSDTHS